MIILPGDPEFDPTLALNLPPDWHKIANQYGGNYGFVVDAESGLIRVENQVGIIDYVEGGEYDDRLRQLKFDDDDDDNFESDWIND